MEKANRILFDITCIIAIIMNKAFEKILERLEENQTIVFNLGGGKPKQSIDFTKAVEIVQEVAEEYNNGWIPCSERLPEDGIDVLVWFEYFRYGNYNRLFQTVGISYTYHGKWSGFVNGQSGWNQLSIIAWQPLPKPYQKGEREA